MNTAKSALNAALLLSMSLPVLAASDTRELEGFTSIEVGNGIDLYIEQDDEFHVEVESSMGNPDDVITEVRNDTLIIRRDRSFFSSLNFIGTWFGDDVVHITLPVLQSLSASGGSSARGDGVFTAEDLELSTSGGSDLAIEVEVDRLEISASGGSDMTVAGTANRVHMETSGGSDMHASDLKAKEADLSSSGGSDISITVLDRLTANASGGSDIRYSGDPGYTDIDESGGSDVKADSSK